MSFSQVQSKISSTFVASHFNRFLIASFNWDCSSSIQLINVSYLVRDFAFQDFKSHSNLF